MPRIPKFASRPGFVRKADRYCEICDQDFSRPAELRRHLKNTLIHNPLSSRKFSCKYCGDLFNNSTNHRIHEVGHLDSKSDRRCGLPLNKDKTELCSFSCLDPHSMVRHMRRAHLEAYNQAQGNLPEWIEKEKAKKRGAARARYTGSNRQAAQAERESKREAAMTTPLTKKAQFLGPPEPSTSKSSFPFKVQVFRTDTMELVGSEPIGAETPVFEISKLRSDSSSFSCDTNSTSSSSSRQSAICDAVPISLDDYHPFCQFPCASNFGFSMSESQTFSNDFGPTNFNDFNSRLMQLPAGTDLFKESASGSFPELLDSQFLFGCPPEEWQTPQDLRLGATNPQQFNLDFFDYSQFTSPIDTFNAFYNGL